MSSDKSFLKVVPTYSLKQKLKQEQEFQLHGFAHPTPSSEKSSV